VTVEQVRRIALVSWTIILVYATLVDEWATALIAIWVVLVLMRGETRA
jgi:hypothetical protein